MFTLKTRCARRQWLAPLIVLAMVVAVPTAPRSSVGAQAGGAVVISELFYNPDGSDEDHEFVELLNPGNSAVDVSGWHFSTGIDSVFAEGTVIGPGERLVVAGDAAAFSAVFGFEPVATFDGRLGNGGETIVLLDSAGAIVDEVTYDDRAPWPTSPDGDGDSLQVLNPEADNDDYTNWGAGAPTPAAASNVNVDVIFSQTRGWYSDSVTVELTATVPGATIRYNTNGGGNPNTNYSAPITVSANGDVRVIQAQASIGASSGPIATHTYVFKPDRGVPTVAAWRVPIPVQPGESESVMSFEFLPPPSTGLVAVQGNAGMALSAAGVSAGQSTKVFFRGDYGNGTLDGDLFSDVYDDGFFAPATEFDQLFLRYEHLDATHQKQLLAHDALLTMGSLAPHGRFVEYHSNGRSQIRHLHERPEAGFMEAYTDVEKSSWIAGSDVTPTTPRSWAEVQQSFDPQQVTDYMLADWHSQDPDSGNLRNVRSAGPPGVGDGDRFRWAFFPWDKDFAYLPATANPWPYVKNVGPESPQFMWQSPGGSRYHLHGVEEMRYLMADRARCAFQPGGALHPDVFHARVVDRDDEYTRAGGLNPSRFWVDPMRSWLERRVEGLLSPLRTGLDTSRASSTGLELYPRANPVDVNVDGQTMTLSSSNPGTIYYRLDGGDPRTLLGQLEPEAIQYTGPVTLPAGRTEVIARSFDTSNPNRFQGWSPACNEPLTFDVDGDTGLVISEVHYNPPSDDLVDGDLREYVEIHNPGPDPVSLGGMQLRATGLTFEPGTIVAPGGYFVAASDAVEFSASYGIAPDGVYPGRLDDGGETIELIAAYGTIIDTVDYDDSAPWPIAADARGAALALVSVDADNALAASWYGSAVLTPGAVNPPPGPPGDVDCDEDLTTADAQHLLDFLTGVRTNGGACPLGDPARDVNTIIADINQDGTIDLLDSLVIAQCVVGTTNAWCEA